MEQEKSSNVIYVNPYDALPWEGYYSRGDKVCSYLLRNNVNITLWASRYNHFLKKYRVLEKSNYKIELINTIGYNNHISLKRLASYFILSTNIFFKLCNSNCICVCCHNTAGN